METLTLIVIGVFGGVVATVVGYSVFARLRAKSASKVAGEIIEKAQKEASTLKKEAELKVKEEQYKARMEFESESEKRRKELAALESRLIHREEILDKKIDLIEGKEKEFERKEQSLRDRVASVQEKEKKYNELKEEAQKTLERIAHISAEEAKKMLMKSMEDAARHESAKKIRRIEEETKEMAEKRSRYILSVAMERVSSGFVADRTVTVVNLPNDDMKGRIIGREGRNIRCLEHLTGVDLIIDDTPEAVVLSGFDPVRREVARISLEKLIADGRIHPARIEEIVKNSTKEINQTIREAGEQALFDLGIHGVHPEIVKLLGVLKYRTSYSQNQLAHSCEVGFLAGIMASELGENTKIAKRAGVLHDIGKAVSHEVEGSHALIGMEMAKKYGEQPLICHAIGSHHEEMPQENVLDFIVDAADTLSGARPGARVEALESYTKRLKDLEDIAISFSGVDSTFAIQAGREIRVLVKSEHVSDDEAILLSKEIAKKIEEQLTYPGTIKVTVIRETRAVEVAK